MAVVVDVSVLTICVMSRTEKSLSSSGATRRCSRRMSSAAAWTVGMESVDAAAM